MQKPILLLLLIFVFAASSYGQDLLAKKAPVDRKMRIADTRSLQRIDVDDDENVPVVKTPILVDNNEGWEWIQNEESEKHDESYPLKMVYNTFKSHPQYKFIYYSDAINLEDYAIFKHDGNLVRVGMKVYSGYLSDNRPIHEVYDILLYRAYVKDYNNNKYNFKKENNRAQNYVKKKLGLAPYNGSRQSTYVPYSEVGYRFLDQLSKDHESDFDNLLKCERIDNLSFKVTFGTESKVPTKTYKVTYVNRGSYRYSISITDMPLEEIEWAKYEKKNTSKNDFAEYPSNGNVASKPNNNHKDVAKVFDVVEEMPQFPGGSSAMFQYISSSIKYPVKAEENGIQGRVVCTFVVDTDGSISDVKVVKSVDPTLDKEAKRIVQEMPKWIPGKQGGALVRVKYTVPVTFRLQ